MQGELLLKNCSRFLVVAGLILCALPASAGNENVVNTSLQTTSSASENTIVAISSNQVSATPSPIVVNNIDQGSVTVVKNPDINTGTVVTNINQENNIFLGPKPTPTLTPTPTPRIITNDYVNLQVTDNQETARPGQRLVYEIIIRNALPWDIELNKVRIHIPEFIIPRGDEVTAGSIQNPQARTIEWHDQVISVGAEVRYTVPAQVDPSAPGNLTIVTNADINGNGISHSASDETTIIRLTAIAAAQDVVAQVPVVVTAPAPAPLHVGVTATTGPELFEFTFAPFATLFGALGLRRSRQSWG